MAKPKHAVETFREFQKCWEKDPICTSVIVTFWQRYLAKLGQLRPMVLPLSFYAEEKEYRLNDDVSVWSQTLGHWVDAKVVGRNCDMSGAVVTYNLNIMQGAPASIVRRPGLAREIAAMQTVHLIMKHMPLKADRTLPGKLLSCLQAHSWSALVQIPRVFRPALPPLQAFTAVSIPQSLPCLVATPSRLSKGSLPQSVLSDSQ